MIALIGKDQTLIEMLSSESAVSMENMLLILLVACVIGIYIYIVYKNFSKSEFYSRDLNVTMAGMTIVVAAIMIAMQSNLIVSLGMVGALSIVRFRTAVKNPLDLMYLFWTISAGIICGVGLFALSGILCILMTLLVFVLGKIPNNAAPRLLVISASEDSDLENIGNLVCKHTKKSRQKSVIVKNGNKEVIYEIRVKSVNSLIDSLNGEKTIKSVTCLEHEGELRV